MKPKKVDGAMVWRMVYSDPLRPAAMLGADGNVEARFVYAMRSNVPDLVIKGDTTYRIVADHLGSPRLVVNATTGEVAQRMEWDEYGRLLSDSNPGFQPFGFAGGLHDSDTGLTRFGARDYDAYAGRWTAKDPILFGGRQTNLYGYSFSDPINFIDADGENPVAIAVAIGLYLLFGGPTDVLNAPGPTDAIQTSDQYGERIGVAIIAGLPGAARGLLRQPDRTTPNSCPYGSTPNGVPYTKHYGTQTGPQRNIPGSVVDETMRRVQGVPGRDNTTVYYDPNNNVTVVTGQNGIVSVHKGAP